MEIRDRVIVVTGAANGVGAAAAKRFAAEGARLVLTDRDADGLARVADATGGVSLAGNITDEATVRAVAALADATYGRVDIWFSNAGASGAPGSHPLRDAGQWQAAWELHVMAHVHAVRAVLPQMLARGEGYLLHTASRVAMAMVPDNAPYSVTKHAALGLNEWLAANFRKRGIRVSCFCPGGMHTAMLRATLPEGSPSFATALTMEQVADILVAGIAAERFLIGNDGPTPTADDYLPKTHDYDAWLDAIGGATPEWEVRG